MIGPLPYLSERWDGKGPLRRAGADAIPLAMRIVHVAVDAALQRQIVGEEDAARLVQEHAGRGARPAGRGLPEEHASEVLGFPGGSSVWDDVLAAEPGPWLWLTGERIDRALAAMGGFADLVCPYHTGHSAGVAELAASAAEVCGTDAAGVAGSGVPGWCTTWAGWR